LVEAYCTIFTGVGCIEGCGNGILSVFVLSPSHFLEGGVVLSRNIVTVVHISRSESGLARLSLSSPSRILRSHIISCKVPLRPHIRVKLPSLLSVRINSRLDLLTNLRGLRTTPAPCHELWRYPGCFAYGWSFRRRIGFYDDDVDVTFAPRKGKGKARVRVESDDEPEDGGKEGCIEATPSRSSTAPPSPNLRLSGGPPEVPVSYFLLLPFPTRPHDEEGDLKPLAYKPRRIASNESPRPGS
jgi:hypothetical protein